MAKIFYGVVNGVDDKNGYDITIFIGEGEYIRLIPKTNFIEKIEKHDVIKITSWRRKNVVSHRYEKANREEVIELYREVLNELVPDGDLLPNFDVYKDYLTKLE